MYLTVTELAKLLRLDRQTIYRKVKDNQIPHLRVGKAVRFDSEEINKWIINGTMSKKGAV